MQKLKLKISRLRLGQTFNVSGENQRQRVLQIAQVLGLRLTTRKRKSGGFTVTRLPE